MIQKQKKMRRLRRLQQHLVAADDATNSQRDSAAEQLQGTEAGTREYVSMRTGTKIAIISGVGPGTGVAIVRKFALTGYKVAMLARSADRLEKLREELTAKGCTVQAYPCDVSDQSACEAVVAAVRKDFGHPSIYVHNAVMAGGAGSHVLDWKEEELTGNFQVNMLAYARFIRLLAPAMIEAGGGSIVCTGNTSAHRGKPFFGSFASTKSGQFVMAESAARYLMPKGVHVCYLTIDAAIAGTPPARGALKRGAKQDFFIQPSAIAEECFHLTQQDRSAWTFDHWIRPFGETW